MKDIIAIVGPTASGKTALSIQLAKHLKTEIICMDSMQIYRFMNIGTAKPSHQEMDNVVHYMLDFVHPSQVYSAAQYKMDAEKHINHIHANGNIPILVGGTGLYLKALCNDMHMGNTASDCKIRLKYEEILMQEGPKHLHNLLEAIDSQTAARLHENDVRRVIRALEVYELTGLALSEKPKSTLQNRYRFHIFGIDFDRAQLVERINQRVDIMMAKGLEKEVRGLLDMGIPLNAQSMQGIGYKELLPYINGEIGLDKAIDLIKIRTRQYAKRQMTWFRATQDIVWTKPDYAMFLKLVNGKIPL